MTNISPWETENPELPFLKRVCYHESGHGVIQYLLGLKSTGIKIDPIKKFGECSHDNRPDIGLAIQSWRITETEREVLHFCGGVTAEWILTGLKVWDHKSGDYCNSVEVLTPICENEEEIDAYLELMLVRAKNLLTKGRNWNAVTELANALILRTENDDKQDRCEMEYVSPQSYLESGRGYREMTGDEVETAIRYALNKDDNTYDN